MKTEGNRGRQREIEGDKGRHKETKGRPRETKGDTGRQRHMHTNDQIKITEKQ